MKLRSAIAAVALGLCVVAWAVSTVAVAATSHDDETKLTSQLAREQDPVKKAKLETRLARLRLERSFAAYSNGQYDDCWKLLGAYQDAMNRAWADLEASGRVASKRSDGFKQLDIGLRESRRDLEDFETHITYDERQTVDKVLHTTEELHDRVLNALFPPSLPKKNQARPHGPLASDPGQGDEPR